MIGLPFWEFAQVYLKGDVIIREGEVSREMYFIKSGAAQVQCALFTEIALFTRGNNSAL